MGGAVAPSGQAVSVPPVTVFRLQPVAVVDAPRQAVLRGVLWKLSRCVWRQARLTTLALCLALCIAPCAWAAERAQLVVVDQLWGLSGVPCWELSADEWGMSSTLSGGTSVLAALFAVGLVGSDFNKRGRQFIPHCIVVGFFSLMVSALLLPGEPSKARAGPMLSYTATAVTVFFMPHVSYLAVKALLMRLQRDVQRRMSARQFCAGILSGLAVSVVGAILGLSCIAYVTVSTGLSGVAGFAINGACVCCAGSLNRWLALYSQACQARVLTHSFGVVFLHSCRRAVASRNSGAQACDGAAHSHDVQTVEHEL
jgi:hypothetical protein